MLRINHGSSLAILILTASCVHGGSGSKRIPPSIEVDGSGTAMGTPDVALLRIGVTAEAASVADARQRAAQAMSAMIEALRKGGVVEKDIQTARLSVEPRYRYTERAPEITGYAVTNVATVKVRAMDRVGDLLDSALAAGGNESRLESLEFTIDDPSALEGQARRAAVEEARKKAGTLAEAAGVRLGEPLSISEGTPRPGPMPYMARAAMAVAESAATPVEPGQLEVRVDVRVVFAIE